jgi:S-formylglutathione hydrolase FrmB
MALTRAQFLALAGGTVVVAGGAAAGLVGPHRIYDHFTRDCGPAGALPPRSDATVTYDTLRTEHAAEPVEWMLAVPPGVDDTARLPVVYCLPGRGSTARTVVDQLRIPDFVAQGIAARGVAPFAVAAFDGGESYYHARASGEDRHAVLGEVSALVEDRLGSSDTARGLLGWSMGGYGALLAAERDPGRYRAVAAASPALWTSYADAVSDAFDDKADYDRNDVFAGTNSLQSLAVRVDCGTSDPFEGATRAFRRQLDPAPEGTLEPGCHDAAYWRRVAPAQVEFLGRALA